MQCYRLENNDTQSSNCCTVTTSGYLSKQTAFGQDRTQRKATRWKVKLLIEH
ncbi:hypothetical protein HOLleu_04113 [Holothuria leucospilota]|uniref:Uncharacterized protein n=1 Tax=Holothuria leucospilota TaxID=206669 RepID=A0A9Q1CTN7_HOLLE|nr:hypothetical protein HOLleu_04113 [Holothuria leucospilota]